MYKHTNPKIKAYQSVNSRLFRIKTPTTKGAHYWSIPTIPNSRSKCGQGIQQNTTLE
jgi:hypothetical protein